MIELAVVAVVAVVVLAALLVYVIRQFENERKAWTAERRFLTDRAIARHVGDVVALDRMDNKRHEGPQPDREHVPTLPEGL